MIQIPKLPKLPWARAQVSAELEGKKPWLRSPQQQMQDPAESHKKLSEKGVVRDTNHAETQENEPVYASGSAVLELPELLAHHADDSDDYVQDIIEKYAWKEYGEDGAVLSAEGHVGAVIDGISGSKTGMGYEAKEIIASVLEEYLPRFPLTNTKTEAKQLMVETIVAVAKAVNQEKVKRKSVFVDAVYSLTYTFTHTDTGEVFTAVANIGDNTVISLTPSGRYYTVAYLGGQQSLKIPNTPEGEALRHKIDEQQAFPKDKQVYEAMFGNNPKRLGGRVFTSAEFEQADTKASVLVRKIAEEELVQIYPTPPGTILVKMSDGAMNNTLSENIAIITKNIKDPEEAAALVVESNAAKMIQRPTDENCRNHPDDATCQIIVISGKGLAQTRDKKYN